MVNDVARAYFEAKLERKIAIELNFPKRSSEIHAVARFRCGKVQL